MVTRDKALSFSPRDSYFRRKEDGNRSCKILPRAVPRAHAALRRAGRFVAPAIRQSGDLTLDPSRRELCIGGGNPMPLPPPWNANSSTT